MKSERLAPCSLGLGGLILMVMGLYFVFIRPPLLPEDLRYIGTSIDRLQSEMPRMLLWLTRVFTVLGGYIFATGLLTLHVAVTAMRQRRPLPRPAVAASGLASIGCMAIVNLLIDSDFKWLLVAFTLPWLIALVLPRSDAGPGSAAAL